MATSVDPLTRALDSAGPLPPIDPGAASALAEAMAGWTPEDLATYRAAVEAEIEALRDRSATGFLVAEAAALAEVTIAKEV
jgi:hypothetical protein